MIHSTREETWHIQNSLILFPVTESLLHRRPLDTRCRFLIEVGQPWYLTLTA